MSEKPLPFIYQLVSGAAAGVSELLVMYPLDVVKTRMQLQVGSGTGSGVAYNGVIDCLGQIVKREGFSRLYKGISSPMLMEAPKRATKFACNDSYQKMFKDLYGVDKLTQQISILSGSLAGVTEACVIVPFELVKIRLQDVNSKFNGPMEVVFKTIRETGILSLYNGLESTMWRNAFWNGGYFGVIFQNRALLPKAKTNTEKTTNDLIAGTIGGTVGTLLNTPFDVVKSRIQSGATTTLADGTVVPKYNWTWPSLFKIYSEEGFTALYKGFIPKILRLGPGGGIMLVVFNGMMAFFQEMKYGK